jgi:excisionase family DNA binding protein
MLTAAQVAELLGISRRMVYDLASRGKLPVYKIEGARRFAPADVEAYRESCRSSGTQGTSAGASISNASLKVAVTGLAEFFRAAGVKPKLTPSTAAKARASMPLRVVSPKPTR